MRDGPGAGLSEIEGLLAKGELDNYPLAHSAKAELCRRAGQMDEAKASFEKALDGMRRSSPITDRVKLAVINALNGAISMDKEIDP